MEGFLEWLPLSGSPPESRFSRSAGLLFALFRIDLLALAALAETPPLDGGPPPLLQSKAAMSNASDAVSRPDRTPPERNSQLLYRGICQGSFL